MTIEGGERNKPDKGKGEEGGERKKQAKVEGKVEKVILKIK